MINRVAAEFNTLIASQRLSGSLAGAVTLIWRRRFGALEGSLGQLQYRGLPFEARRQDWCAVQEVFLDNEYDSVLELLNGRSSPVVVDLGANIGAFSLYIMAHVADATLHAYEPSADTWQVLQRNLQANRKRARGMEAHCEGVWRSKGRIGFDRKEFSTGRRILADAPDASATIDTVDLDTVLARIGRTVDLLKMDIEGAEEAALAGKEHLLSRIGSIVIEIHPDRCNGDLVIRVLKQSFDHLYRIPGRASSKPLLVASREVRDLPPYAS